MYNFLKVQYSTISGLRNTPQRVNKMECKVKDNLDWRNSTYVQIKCHICPIRRSLWPSQRDSHLISHRCSQGQRVWWMKHQSGYCLMSLEGVRRKKSKIRTEADQVDTHLILARQSEDVIFDKNMITPFLYPQPRKQLFFVSFRDLDD